MYADYSYYKEKYGGITVPEERWNYYEAKAAAYVDAVTFGRITEGNITDEVKNAVCDVSERFCKADKSKAEQGITSEHIGDYSVSYGNTSEALKNELKSAVRFWLINTGLLYKGDENADE